MRIGVWNPSHSEQAAYLRGLTNSQLAERLRRDNSPMVREEAAKRLEDQK